MKTKLKLAKPEHQVFYQEILDLITRHQDKLSSEEMLAVAANMVGKFMAMLDQRSVTAEEAMEIVCENLEHGNREMIEQFFKIEGAQH